MGAADSLSCFKAYDIRGKVGDELNEDTAYRIGGAFAQYLKAKTVVVGGDIRYSSPYLKQALAHGLIDAGVKVIDIGTVGTEEVYFAAFYLDVDGGIEVTASHNPLDYNGMKLVGRGASAISGDSGLRQINKLAAALTSPYPKTGHPLGTINFRQTECYTTQSILEPYIEHILSYIAPTSLRPLRLVVNSGNGAAGHVIDAIEQQFQKDNIPVEFIKIHHDADGSFPNGIPNPLLPENRASTSDAVLQYKADMGIAWDGDFDRCFLFDEKGRFIEGYYIVGLLAEAFLRKAPRQKIIHDPRLTWNTIDQVKTAGGIPVQSKTGHAFIKERMRKENAIYGGEMSAHHYFRDFAYCDSGMIPWLLVIEQLSELGRPLSQLVNQRVKRFPCSGEINFHVEDAPATMRQVTEHYIRHSSFETPVVEYIDGVSIEFTDWRFNLRSSNTEPLLRLNLETRGDCQLLADRLNEIQTMIKGH